MKLYGGASDAVRDANTIRDIEYLLQQPAASAARVCNGCDKECETCGARDCTCMCSARCEHAPFAMSSDPIRYPIEARITALVYGFNSLRICAPYWSCEGHSRENGELYRVPQIWFYADSIIYPKLIGQYIGGLEHEGKITYPWHICLTFADNPLEAGFSLEPNMKLISDPQLDVMQNDVAVIAENFADGLKALAQTYVDMVKA